MSQFEKYKHTAIFLNKIIEEGDYLAIARYNINIDDMHNEIDRNTFRFIEQYAQENGGKTPSWAVVADSVEGFEYIPEVSDNYTYLARQIKDFSAQQEIINLFKPKKGKDKDGKDITLPSEFEEQLSKGGHEFVNNWLPTVLESVKMRTTVRESVGTDVKKDADKFLEEYERRREGKSFKIWKSKFSAIGEYLSANLYTVTGGSGRGKSVITLEDAIYVASQGANVLVWAMEMGWFEVMVRIYTSISGENGAVKAKFEDLDEGLKWLEGVEMDAGFNAEQLRRGNLADKFDEAFREFVRTLNKYLEGNITVRAVDDEDFIDRSLRALQADIERLEADFIVLDPFYYLDFGGNKSRTTGGDAAETSKRLRSMTGRLGVVTVAITQTSDKSEEDDGDASRELKLPGRESVTTTKRLLQDASVLIGVDSDWRQGQAIVGNLKGRDGGEGKISNVTYLPQFGVIKELETGEEALKGFDF